MFIKACRNEIKSILLLPSTFVSQFLNHCYTKVTQDEIPGIIKLDPKNCAQFSTEESIYWQDFIGEDFEEIPAEFYVSVC